MSTEDELRYDAKLQADDERETIAREAGFASAKEMDDYERLNTNQN